ncbi:methyltransferase domain-containing protein [Lactiplantibacillus mudanjiangensis]|uniref:rRNA large subunit methyltransferase A [Lactobacillus plantarum JDM1] n=1 Tax=Lactiplantibacillus mudanjiangensis TaxID=1296538 RepID=A0A660EAJ9_9LACO|nr:methyltransferase domain-containing protein [Lactiplantibacillus mudanjiangensis]VDG20783.1 rRNA large subunit methyltransferase A [Lactobacillus plantarum JDM1] [Lactiplantibacillus mudanjiangensis]VDG24476.1 rRNA large subunit methyltransferase A [Lactobacillus plantarum JDM1] [Lactiplantibacillus mudanjiangensis]VDG30052.1 rRNA large subunit methyltransferase A [Lactobacillus plantarum JDM1] [Lactiplantibacillus mudanjiangensis]VDG30539.1 rRNA large subunit methyltransferase A [Lactobacil
MKKIDQGSQFVQRHLALFKCLVCDMPYAAVEDHTLKCPNGHQLDFSKKGTLYFLTHQVQSEYDAAMLAARRRILQAGFFKPIVTAINEQLPAQPQRILDIGSGEGTPLADLLTLHQQPKDVGIGFDISKDGVNLATQLVSPAYYCVADLAQLPFTNNAFTAIMDVFSPSAYQEFERVLAPGGQLLKVVPNANYLVELRHLLFEPTARQYQYDNQKVLDLFSQHYPQAEQRRIQYEFDLSTVDFNDLMVMTPLHWGATAERLAQARIEGLAKITIDVSLLTVTM